MNTLCEIRLNDLSQVDIVDVWYKTDSSLAFGLRGTVPGEFQMIHFGLHAGLYGFSVDGHECHLRGRPQYRGYSQGLGLRV